MLPAVFEVAGQMFLKPMGFSVVEKEV